MSLAQGNNTASRPRIEPGSPDPESDALLVMWLTLRNAMLVTDTTRDPTRILKTGLWDSSFMKNEPHREKTRFLHMRKQRPIIDYLEKLCPSNFLPVKMLLTSTCIDLGLHLLIASQGFQ